ncbi:3-ketoacyl-ACP reductase [Georgenia muralis]|uniref:NAD(P)-dependent dehydrogenase (Short-subunit alcohol dehydrogenase family) n=1 Tax=Georgenia muralis TaxID=154117 RepID=A0A3N4ZM51_9MICO|nr:3-ketoacyl-ACP reductase [Georgenia muralis]RPF26858.1 NAD(P)-dependent dehydrogenase (short-subunit alcohol dehydrogenase family) [Georgenia muralis]
MPKVAMITGGNRGIGLGISERLLDEGYAVSILATREEPADVMGALRERGEAIYVRGSVADLDDHARYVDATLEAFGRIDVLVNNAGVAPTVRDDILVATPESYDRVMDINLRGPYFLTQRVAAAMIEARGELTELPEAPIGTIVNVSSISATVVSTNRGEYCMSKAGGAMATQLWAARLAPEGIVVYEVRPGVIATDMTSGVKEKYDALFAGGLAPMPRWGRPSDVAGAVAQLVAGQMPYSTGDVINVDGGMHIARL